MNERWYKPSELAEIWGVSRSMIQKLISQGRLGALRIGDMWRIRESDVEAYEAANFKAAAVAAPVRPSVCKIV